MLKYTSVEITQGSEFCQFTLAVGTSNSLEDFFFVPVFKKDVLSFQKPRPLGLECEDMLSVNSEWSVFKPGKISAEETLPIKLWDTKKKSSLQWTSGCFWRQVYLQVSGFKSLHASTRSRFSEISLTVLLGPLCSLGRPPFLSFCTSNTRLKSLPIIISSFWKSSIWSARVLKKFGSSSLGA